LQMLHVLPAISVPFITSRMLAGLSEDKKNSELAAPEIVDHVASQLQNSFVKNMTQLTLFLPTHHLRAGKVLEPLVQRQNTHPATPRKRGQIRIRPSFE
jgi:hypothetical protein